MTGLLHGNDKILHGNDKKRRKGTAAGLFGAMTMMLLLFVLFPAGAFAGFFFGKDEWIVGKDIPGEDVTEFYCTYASSTNPPDYQRYHFYVKDGSRWFYHEKREGNHWPLRETDITASGTVKLTDEQWAAFSDLVKGGRVEKRKEHTESGGRGPWLFLYWKGDKGKYQEFSFESREKLAGFEKFCAALKAGAAGAKETAGTEKQTSLEKQISLLANREDVWGADSFFRDWQADGGSCAVTDLDGNGRLEIFFVRPVRNPVPGANAEGTNEEKGRALVASVPVTMRVRGFEVSADGERLEELKFNYPDKIVPPDLPPLREGFYNAEDKIRFFNVATLNRVDELGYSLYRQVVSLREGTVTVQTIGTEYGNYGLFSEYPTAEAIFDYAEDRYGTKMQAKAFNDYVKAYSAGANPAVVKTAWISAYDWKKARTTPGGVRAAFAQSWIGFKFEL